LRPAEIAGDKGSKVYSGPVTVWHRGILLTGSTNIMALQIRDSLRDAIAEFVAQYLKDNPEVTSALGPRFRMPSPPLDTGLFQLALEHV